MFNKKISSILLLTMSSLVFLSGCSMKDPFGVGYDSSVCSKSKSFGVCGAPKDVYKYRDKIRSVQNKYLQSKLDTTLYFSITPNGIVQVKADRDGQWERYDISEWSRIIEKRLREENLRIRKNESLAKSFNRNAIGLDSVINSDIPVTKGGDLSVKYQSQGPLLVTRTRIGDIIRDQGLVQQVFVANYADTDGDLVSSHELFVVVRKADWVVGEKTPKNVSLDSFPTPISTKLIGKQQKINKYQEKTIKSYNIDSSQGYVESKNEPVFNSISEEKDSAIINQYLNK